MSAGLHASLWLIYLDWSVMRLLRGAGLKRRLKATSVGLAVLALFFFVSWALSGEWGLTLLAGGLLLTLLHLRSVKRQLRAAEKSASERDGNHLKRWQHARGADRGRLRELQTVVEGVRDSVDARLVTIERAQERAVVIEAARRALHRREHERTPMAVTRDRELELITNSALFDPSFYSSAVGMHLPDPVAHYVDKGSALGFDPHPLFATKRYLDRHPEVFDDWRTPLGHFLGMEVDPNFAFGSPIVAHDEAGNPLVDDLKWEYLSRGLHHKKNLFVLYRILGNDLPPRHSAGQTIENLQFIIENEPDLERCEKRWVVNRISDAEIEKEIIALLDRSGMEYLRIPFDLSEYRRVGWHFMGLNPPGLTYRTDVAGLDNEVRQHVLDHIYHDKNLYAMNNNGARNAALRDGRGAAKWVLPFDGNCFFTEDAWRLVVQRVDAQPFYKYFTVPMARIVDNSTLLRAGLKVKADEEPQLIFRNDALEEFDLGRRYGRRPKVELFYRLRIPGPWDKWGGTPWDAPYPDASPEARQVGQAGWVARLSSGKPLLETDSTSRQWGRVTAIREYIDGLDERIARSTFDSSKPCLFDEVAFATQQQRWSAGDPTVRRVADPLLGAASKAKLTRADAENVARVSECVTMLTIAGLLTRDERSLSRAADFLRRGVLAGRSAIAKGRHGGIHFPVTVSNSFHDLLDMARLLESEGALSQQEAVQLREKSKQCQRWLEHSDAGRSARSALDHLGTWYDLQVAALCAYVDDVRGILNALRRAHERMEQQFSVGGWCDPTDEPAASDPHARLVNLQLWVQLAKLARGAGQDLLSHRRTDGTTLADTIRRQLCICDANDVTGLWELHESRLVLAHEVVVRQQVTLHEPCRHVMVNSNPWEVRQEFPYDAGVRRYWIFGGGVVDAE